MKKYLLLIITCVFLFPIFVLAEECKKDDIVVSKIELNEVRGNAEEIDNPNNENNQINLNTKMNVIGDSLTYKVVIKNTSNSDYVFEEKYFVREVIESPHYMDRVGFLYNVGSFIKLNGILLSRLFTKKPEA